MSSFLGKKAQAPSAESVHDCINDSNPIRIAFFGGAKSGKTSTITKLSLGHFRDTYYPTHQITPTLHTYSPEGLKARYILDDVDLENSLGHLSQEHKIVLSPVIYQSYSRIQRSGSDNSTNNSTPGADISVSARNPYYVSYKYKSETETRQYVPPHVSPVLLELIDTPNFNPAHVVPFLEASLYVKLGKEYLRNLADEPRQPVSTNPLLVASGASELNGNVDGYFFVYSAVPSAKPPSYNDSMKEDEPQPLTQSISTSSNSSAIESFVGDGPFKLLSIMKDALDEAWKEFTSFKKRWEQGKEHDIFSLKLALKNMWKESNTSNVESLRLNINTTLLDYSVDPADPDSLPPIWILCTNTDSPLASPRFIENGIKLAKFWKCGFVGIDNANDDVDEALALMVREIVERKKLQKGKKRFHK